MTARDSNNPGRRAKFRRLAALLAGLLVLAAMATGLSGFGVASAQPVAEWRTTLGGGSEEFAHAVALADGGGYVIAGETRSFGSGSQDGWLVKLDANGNQLWAQAYGGTKSDVIYAVQKTSDGGYILAGETHSSENATVSQSDYWLIKTNTEGMVEWERSYGNSEQPLPPATGKTSDVAHAVRQTRDGGYILAGASTGSSGSGVWLVRTAADGRLLWSRNPGVSDGAVAYDVAQTADGGFAIAGNAASDNRARDALLLKTDSDGNTEWTKSLGGQFNDETRSLVLTSDGGYALGGFSWSYGSGLSDFWMVKTNENGRVEWQRSFGGVARDAAHTLIQTSDGGFALAGWSESFSSGDRFWLIKTGPSGGLEWSRTYPQPPLSSGEVSRAVSAGARAIRQTEDLGFIIVGWSGAIQGARNILAIKTAPIEERPAATEGPVVTLQNTGGVSITTAVAGFSDPESGAFGSPLRFWHNGRLIDRDNPLPSGAVACTQPAARLVSGARLAFDQIGSFESVYLNALSRDAQRPTVEIDGGSVDFQFIGNGDTIAGSFAVVSQSPCGQSDRLLPEGPLAPTGLSAALSETHQETIALDWDDNAESDVSGYAVYFSRQSTGPFERIAWLLPESGHDDIRTGDGETYYYAVSAINSWGLESPKSPVAEVDSLDITPPEPPTSLRLISADRSAGRARLEWNASLGDAIRGYRLYRQDGEETRTPVTALLFGAQFEDWTLPTEGEFNYSVTEIDLTGNESGHSNIVPAELDFFGNVVEVRRNFTSGGRLAVNTGQGRVDVDVASDTEISVRNRPNASLDDLDLGDQVAVSLKSDGSVARQVHLVPANTQNRHLAGRVISVSESETVIQPTEAESEQVVLPLSDSVEINLHRGAAELSEDAFVVVSYAPGDGESAPVVSEINVIPGPETEDPPEESEVPETPGNVAVLRGVFQGINPENAHIILSSIEVSLDVQTVMETGLSVGEAVVVEALLLPDGTLLARRVGQDEGVGEIAFRTILRGVFQSRDADTGRWTVSGVSVLVDHRSYTDALPRAGQRVKVTAILREDGSLHARTIENRAETEDPDGEHTVWLEGIFQEITAGGSWDVGGLPVEVNADTVLSGRPSVSHRVTVTATNSPDALLATEVSAAPPEKNLPVRSVSIRGVVEDHDEGSLLDEGAILVVNGVKVTQSDITKTLGDIGIGSTVSIKAEIEADGSLVAREVSEVNQDGETDETRASPVDIEGRIERVDSDGSLLVNGIPVTVSALTVLDAALQVGAPVQVRGLLRRDGTVLAREILGYGPGITGGTEASIEGVVNRVSTGPAGRVSSFVTGGIPVTVDRLTRLEVTPTTGVAVAVQAIVIGGEILAVTVESQPLGNVGVLPKVQMQGVVENMPSGPVPLPLDVTINGVTVRISGDTQIIGSLTGGAVVKVTGRISDNIFLAKIVERITAYDYQDDESPPHFIIHGTLQEARLDSEGRPDRLLVAGESIIVEALTVFEDTVATGNSVTAEGVIRDGILIATKISLRESEEQS